MIYQIMRRSLFLYMLTSSSTALYSHEYIYPVAVSTMLQGSPFLYVVHQKSVDNLQLFAWDPQTGEAYLLLHTLFMPLGVSPLPDNSGFSFIDKGRICIKHFNKRSPKTIELHDSIYDPAGIVWTDSYNGYFYGKKRDTYGIFHISSTGEICPIASDDQYDYLYPQKVNRSLFYIRRSQTSSEDDRCYCIMQGAFPVKRFDGNASFNDEEHFHETIQALIQAEELCEQQEGQLVYHDAIAIINCGKRSIAFLSMIDESRGFFIEHDTHFNRQLPYITCICHEFVCHNSAWTARSLFTYRIPTHLFIDPELRIVDSRLLLVPYYYRDTFYFSDCLGNLDELRSFQYICATDKIVQVPIKTDRHLSFAPLVFNGMLFYGGIRNADSLPCQWEQGDTFLDLPAIK